MRCTNMYMTYPDMYAVILYYAQKIVTPHGVTLPPPTGKNLLKAVSKFEDDGYEPAQYLRQS